MHQQRGVDGVALLLEVPRPRSRRISTLIPTLLEEVIGPCDIGVGGNADFGGKAGYAGVDGISTTVWLSGVLLLYP